MNEQTKQENLTPNAEKTARVAVEDGKNIQDTVRDITLEALSEGHLDVQKMREVVQAVLQGASLGVREKDDRAEQALQEAMAGVDEALAKSAEASRLAIEEAAGNITLPLSMIPNKIADHKRSQKEFTALLGQRLHDLADKPEVRKAFIQEMRRFLPPQVIDRTVEKKEFWGYLTDLISAEGTRVLQYLQGSGPIEHFAM